jgi:hypothetical protein
VLIAAVERRSRRHSKEPLPSRKDEEYIWHLRSGHLGEQALRHLAKNTRGAQISGTKRIKCEVCAQVYAKKVVSRRPPRMPAQRPFWRISWDVMHYPPSYDGCHYLFVVRDEYTGLLYAQPIKDRAHHTIFNCILAFVEWVWNQYQLRIAKIKHDGERSVVQNMPTDYQRWAYFMGIELEITPPDTHEPNGGIERANQEIQTKAIAMRMGAGLPEELWTEITQAACYLLNCSPRQRFEWKTPFERLYSWLEKYTNLGITEQGKDHRPDLNNWNIYGCRAYPLQRDREGGRNRKWYKVNPRGHIGYLVGYVATNLYRIWIPSLERVVTTRNVQLDEDITYKDAEARTSELSIAETQEALQDLLESDTPLPLNQTAGASSSGVTGQAIRQTYDPSIILETNQMPENQDLSAPESPPADRQLDTNQGARRPLSQQLNREISSKESANPTRDHVQDPQLGIPTPNQTPEPNPEGIANLPIPDQQNPSSSIKENEVNTQEAGRPSRQERRKSERQHNRVIRGLQRSFANQPNKPGIFASLLMKEADEILKEILPDQQYYQSSAQEDFQTVFSVFNAMVKVHLDTRQVPKASNLPPPPRNDSELDNHPLSDQFKAARREEINALQKDGHMDESQAWKRRQHNTSQMGIHL